MSNLKPIYNDAILYKQGGVVSYLDATTVGVTPILCRDSTDSIDINVGDYFGEIPETSQPTVVNIAAKGLNGLDTGTVAASKVYALFVIADSGNFNKSGFILSLNTSMPVMPRGLFPSGYDSYRRIGWVVTTATTDIAPMYVSGSGSVMTYYYDAPITVLTAGTATAQSAVSLAAVVPATNYAEAVIAASFTPAAASRTAKICIPTTTIANSKNVITGQVAAVVVTQNFQILYQNASGIPSIFYNVSNADSPLTLSVVSFVDKV